SENLSLEQIPNLSVPVVLTNRSPTEGGKTKKHQDQSLNVESILQSPFEYIDIEITKAEETIPQRATGEIIFSKHWHTSPQLNTMEQILDQFGEKGIVKLIPTATTIQDNLTVLEFLKTASEKDFKMIAFCMGALGTVSRLLSPYVGGLWTYASHGTPVAEGQMPTEYLRRIYDDIMG
ncbi:MAG: type I 3-dehydroquinate dehydratase, partial [Candidatus Ranarchaeia archaeon]